MTPAAGLEVVALFAASPEPPPGAEACPPAPAAACLDPAAGHALLFEPDELPAAAAAALAWRLRCDGTAASVSALLDHVAACHRLGALAIVLPAAGKAFGPAALAALVPALGETAGRLRLFVQPSVAQERRWLRTFTRGMAYLGLPDLVCRTPADRGDLATQLVEGCIVHLATHGAGALQPGGMLDATAADGSWLARFRVARSAGTAPGDTGALSIVALPSDAGDDDAPWHRLDAAIARRQRAVGLDLRGAALAGLDLSGLKADRLDLSRADLRGALLAQARLGDCRLDGAQLAGADLAAAVLRPCALDGAQAAGACFDEARLEDGSARGADFSGASLRGARLTQTTFERAVLREAALDGARGAGTVFRGADLGSASLAGARLDEADFRGADLQGADLTDGRFVQADFRGALLDGARFDGADLTGALFDRGEEPRRPGSATAGRATAAAGSGAGSMAATIADAMAAPAGAAPSDERRPPGIGETDIEEALRRIGDAGLPAADLLGSLLERMQATADGQADDPVAARLRPLLQRLQELERCADTPEAAVQGLQALLHDTLPPLNDVLCEADWQTLSRLLSRLQPGPAGETARPAPSDPR